MVMSRGEWDALQARLPEEDRMSYAQYLAAEGVTSPPPGRIARGEQGIIGAASIARQQAQLAQEAINEPMDITSRRYTAAAIAAGLTPTPSGVGGPANIPVFESGPTGPTGPGATGPTGPTGTPTGPTGTPTGPTGTPKTLVSTYTDPITGDVIAVYSDGSTAVLSKGTKQSDAARAAAEKAAAEQAQRQSAFDLLLGQFTQYGLQALVEPLRALIKQGVPASEFTIRLRETDAYKKRFAANAQRINKGLRALSEAEYIKLEDDYQDVMRRYGLPASYYERGELGRQQGFEKFIAGDVSAPELERRVQMAQERVMDADPMIGQTLREFYPTITNGEILAFALDPDRALPEINRKITAAEIGSAQYGARLVASRIRAEELAAAGVTGKQYQQAAPTIADITTRGSTLSEFYNQGPFGQTEAEQESLNLSGAAQARERRRKLTQLEQASFAGQAGAAGGALGRERAGAF